MRNEEVMLYTTRYEAALDREINRAIKQRRQRRAVHNDNAPKERRRNNRG